MVKKKSEEILMSEQEVYDVLLYAKELGYNNAILTPMLINARMRDITLNPVQATENSLTQAMNDPKDNELMLQEFSQDFEIQSQVYKKLLEYLGNLLSFDMTYECINAKPEDYKTPAYKKDLDEFKKFIDGFEYKAEFSRVVGELLRNEAAFYCPREDSGRLVLQELPASPTYTMITGRWLDTFSFDFNFYWFLQPGVDIKMYPPFFRKKYNELWGGKPQTEYISSTSPFLRDGNYIYWQQIPADIGWVFKFNPSIATRVPHFAGLFLDLIQQPLMRALQKNINMSVAARMILGEVGTLKDAQAKVKDQFAINPETLGKFLALVKAAVGESMKVAAAPLENMKPVEFAAENDVYNSTLKTTLASSGVNANLVFTSDAKPNTIETQLSLNVDEQLMCSLYPQFELFLNHQINKRTKHYKFKIHFEGTQFFNNRQQRLDTQTTLLGLGIVLPQKVAAAIGMNPFEFQRQLDEAKAMGWVDGLTPITPAAQTSAKESAGRPAKKDGELSDSGDQTRSTGSNIGKGGKK